MYGQENASAQPGGGTVDESMTSAQERQRRPPPLPTFPLIITL